MRRIGYCERCVSKETRIHLTEFYELQIARLRRSFGKHLASVPLITRFCVVKTD